MATFEMLEHYNFLKKMFETQLCMFVADDHLKRNDIEGARKFYNEALTYDPNNLEAVIGLAHTYLEEKNYDEVERKLMYGLVLEPQKSQITQFRTKADIKLELALFITKHREKSFTNAILAAEFMEDALKEKPELIENYLQDYGLMLYQRAKMTNNLDDAYEALKIFNKIVEEEMTNPLALIGKHGSLELIEKLKH